MRNCKNKPNEGDGAIMKRKLYRLLVDRVPGIRDRYFQKRHRSGSRFCAFGYLLWLNLQYYLLFRRSLRDPSGTAYHETALLYSAGSESSLSAREAPEALAQKLMAYDVISFDVFDTLIFRPFSCPADVFYLVGMDLDYPDFTSLRVQAERRAREKKHKNEGTGEVTLEEIWRELEKETGIPMDKGMTAEWKWETRCCYANPYMLQVVNLLQNRGKRVIACSDMYLGSDPLRRLLTQCGYSPFQAYFVSSEYGKSKYDGGLYSVIWENVGQGGSWVHIGDNEESDVRQARRHRVYGMSYPNVQAAGEKYRPKDMSALTGSLYKGLVNAWIHNGMTIYSKTYEYGFLYGGLFVVGYCRFIHEYAEQHGVDKLLFLSRDGAVLLQAYSLLYPRERERTVYAYWSRLAAVKLSAGYYKADYFRRFLSHKVDQGFTLNQVLESMELSDLVEELCREIHTRPETELTNKNAEDVKCYLQRHWDMVLEHYADQHTAAKQYYQKLLEGCRSAAAVDIGWAGSGAVMLHHLVNYVWHLECPITGLIAGTNSGRSPEPDAAEPQLFSGRLVSYLYSQEKNRDLWHFHDPAAGHNLYWELLLGAPEGSLKGFYLDGGGHAVCRFKPPVQNPDSIREIHRGILDFVRLFLETEDRLGVQIPISGRDAYAPMLTVCHPKNKAFLAELEELMDDIHLA